MSWLPSPEYADWWYDLSWKGIIGFGAMAAFATAATVAFTVIQFWSDGVRDQKADERNRAMEVQVAAANAKTAELEKEAASLKAQAEADRLARVKIEDKLAPRSLSGEQQRAISEKIRPFAPQRFEFVSYQDDGEVVQLVHTLVRLLVVSGWQGVPATGFLMVQLEVGVRVEFSSDKEKDLGPAATALAEALNAAGIAASTGARPKMASTDILKIRVGKKP